MLDKYKERPIDDILTVDDDNSIIFTHNKKNQSYILPVDHYSVSSRSPNITRFEARSIGMTVTGFFDKNRRGQVDTTLFHASQKDESKSGAKKQTSPSIEENQRLF